MAPRYRKRPLTDRAATAKRAVELERAWFKVHVKVCSRCAKAGEHLWRRCDEGWQSAKVEHRFQLAWEARVAEADIAARQGTLW